VPPNKKYIATTPDKALKIKSFFWLPHRYNFLVFKIKNVIINDPSDLKKTSWKVE
tara:strand:+ start:219 stop:383 length:165 start_codon:yes stop_codon:yes gene_type:complete